MKKFFSYIKPTICMVLCVVVCIIFLCLSFTGNEEVTADEEALICVWQIDSFEGGKGSRADFLQKTGNDFADRHGCYVTVTSLSADAARLNLEAGNMPDIISYGAGTYGLENYIVDYKTWCSGGYCFLTLDTDSDFSDINMENTVINGGKDNFARAVALMCGLQNAKYEKPTGAYVKLINGDYKYLLGTQRDIYRLKTREVNFAVKPITCFNDLYQDISVTTTSKNREIANRFIDYLLSINGDVSKLGMLSDKAVYDNEMKLLQGIDYECKLTAPISLETSKQLENIIAGGDINMLKNLLK